MPLFSIDIEKYLITNPGNPWTNQYHCQAADLDAADAIAEMLIGFEESITSTQIILHQWRSSTVAPRDGIFRTTPLNVPGDRVFSGDFLPMFLATRVDFIPAFGRAGRKFYHLGMLEGDQANGRWSDSYISFIQTNIDAMFGTVGPSSLCNPTGTHFYTAGNILPSVTEHQFRRGSKRRVPILG